MSYNIYHKITKGITEVTFKKSCSNLFISSTNKLVIDTYTTEYKSYNQYLDKDTFDYYLCLLESYAGGVFKQESYKKILESAKVFYEKDKEKFNLFYANKTKVKDFLFYINEFKRFHFKRLESFKTYIVIMDYQGEEVYLNKLLKNSCKVTRYFGDSLRIKGIKEELENKFKLLYPSTFLRIKEIKE